MRIFLDDQRIKPEDYLALAITLIQNGHIEQLKELSITNEDRIELKYRQLLKSNTSLSKDVFLGLLLKGNLDAIAEIDRPQSSKIVAL